MTRTSITHRLACSLAAATLAALALAGCDDRSSAPERSSPELTVLGELGTDNPVLDRMRAEPTWLAAAAQQVLRLRGGAIEIVQERTLSDLPADLYETPVVRVLDDETIVVLANGDLHIYPVGGDPIVEDLGTMDVAIAGLNKGDIWYAAWFIDDRGYRLCHRTAAGTDCGVELPNMGAFSTSLALADDGSVYVTDRDTGVYRFKGGDLLPIGKVESPEITFRRGGAGTFAMAGPQLLAIEGNTMDSRYDSYVWDVVGANNDYYRMTLDAEYVQVDPDCDDGWGFRHCEERILWSQVVIERDKDGEVTEVGHETCDDAHPDECQYLTYGLGIDEGRVILLGEPMRALAP